MCYLTFEQQKELLLLTLQHKGSREQLQTSILVKFAVLKAYESDPKAYCQH